MRTKPNRPITDAEATVVRLALARAAVIPAAVELVGTIPNLRVIDQCHCGCASVDFAFSGNERPEPIADGTATTPAGGGVGIIVWGTRSAIAGLEIYDCGAGDDDLGLPVPESIIAWDKSAA
jgi:hypothetical protein